MKTSILLALLAVSMLAMHCATASDTPAANQRQLATVKFETTFPEFEPQHFTVSIDSAGHGAYSSESAATKEDGEAYSVDFTASEQMRDRIFDLARAANYFQGDFEYKKHRVAFTGHKLLSYADAEKQFSTSYNWSQNPAIDELTRIFQNISRTLEAAPRLEFLQRFDKLSLEAELKKLEDLAKSNQLAEIHAIAPLLQKIAEDHGVMNVARERAFRLLERAQTEKVLNTSK